MNKRKIFGYMKNVKTYIKNKYNKSKNKILNDKELKKISQLDKRELIEYFFRLLDSETQLQQKYEKIEDMQIEIQNAINLFEAKKVEEANQNISPLDIDIYGGNENVYKRMNYKQIQQFKSKLDTIKSEIDEKKQKNEERLLRILEIIGETEFIYDEMKEDDVKNISSNILYKIITKLPSDKQAQAYKNPIINQKIEEANILIEMFLNPFIDARYELKERIENLSDKEVARILFKYKIEENADDDFIKNIISEKIRTDLVKYKYFMIAHLDDFINLIEKIDKKIDIPSMLLQRTKRDIKNDESRKKALVEYSKKYDKPIEDKLQDIELYKKRVEETYFALIKQIYKKTNFQELDSVTKINIIRNQILQDLKRFELYIDKGIFDNIDLLSEERLQPLKREEKIKLFFKLQIDIYKRIAYLDNCLIKDSIKKKRIENLKKVNLRIRELYIALKTEKEVDENIL